MNQAGARSPLAWALSLNALGSGVLGLGLYLVCRRVRWGGWLGRRIAALRQHGPEIDAVLREAPRFPLRALVICVLGRLIQVTQYGVILLAVGGQLGLCANHGCTSLLWAWARWMSTQPAIRV